MPCSAIAIALRELAAHRAIVWLGEPASSNGRVRVEFDLSLEFGDRWIAEGQSPTGVKPIERVRFDFGPRFPLVAPEPSLRADFSRSHAHFQPRLTSDGRPVPCLVLGSVDEFMASRGLLGLLEQLWSWLRKAADDALALDETWEPMRRGEVRDFLACDLDAIRVLARPVAGYALLGSEFRNRLDDDNLLCERFSGRAGDQADPAAAIDVLLQRNARQPASCGVAVVVWADQRSDGKPIGDDEFRPDDVMSVDTLMAQAHRFRVHRQLEAAWGKIAAAAKGKVAQGLLPTPVIMLAKRPKPVLGSSSPIELVAYLVQLSLPSGIWATTEVRPLACVEDVRPSLLRRLSNEMKAGPWALLGAGSLGSKIALHRARAGAAPVICSDPRLLRPHNAARHGLYPPPAEGLRSGWLDYKALELGAAINGLGQHTAALLGDHQRLVEDLRRPGGPRAEWLLNTTGSTIAREGLAADPTAPRGAEAGLFDDGSLGYLNVEGAQRNPDALEEMSALFELARQRPDLREKVFKPAGQLGFVPIGQGCDSETMMMSDARLSAMAAPMAEIFAQLSPGTRLGRIHVLMRDGLGLRHEVHEVQRYARTELEGLDRWTVSVSDPVQEFINADIAEWPDVETGGVLVGWVSAIARRIVVVATLDAPPDSLRSAAEFRLGVVGLPDALAALSGETAGALYCVGTWHSHLGTAAPSGRDWASAAMIGREEARPMTLLIKGADGLRAISTTAAAQTVEAAGRGSQHG